jgi:HPt (histidine-containing phosphotransfer) domain-containing protein
MQLLSRLAAGTERYTDPQQGRRAVITLALALTYTLLLAPYIGLYLWFGLPQAALGLAWVIGAYLAVWRIVCWGSERGLLLARVLFMTTYSAAVVLFSGYLGHETGIHMLHYAGGCLAFVICGLRERGLIAYSLAVCVGGNLLVELGREALFPEPVLWPQAQFVLYLGLIPSTFATMLSAVFYFARASVQAEQRLQRILDTVDQGLVMVGMDGVLASERSSALDRMFGAPQPGDTLWSYLTRAGADGAQWEMGWEQLRDGFLPLELCLDQLPARVNVGGRHLALTYRPVDDQILLVASDITDEVARAHSELIGRETLGVFERMMRSHGMFLDFFEESAAQILALSSGTLDRVTTLRIIHTLKGNCGLMGVESVARVCHEVESAVALLGEAPSAAEIDQIVQAWTELSERLEPLLGQNADKLDVSHEDYEEVRQAVARGEDLRELARLLDSWTLERGGERLGRLAEQARAVAARCGKELEVEVLSDRTRFLRQPWAAFWSSLVHVVRNSIDHGLEDPEERVAQGKPAQGHLKIRLHSDHEERMLVIEDDGRGIDWEGVREKAKQRGLPHRTRDDLVAALFHDGFSTKTEVSQLSGRGVGMSAVLQATLEVGGELALESEPGRGTRLTFRFPLFKQSQCA